MFLTLALSGERRSLVSDSLKLANEYVADIARSGHAVALWNIDRCRSPVADLPTATMPVPAFCGDVDGFSVSFGRDEIIVFPTWDQGAAAVKAAREAQAWLAASLSNKPEAA